VPEGLGVWIVGALLLGFVFVLVSRYLHRDSSVKSTRFGFYVERERYVEEGEIWTVDPLPPPTPPPPLPPRPPDEDEATQVDWPKRDEP